MSTEPHNDEVNTLLNELDAMFRRANRVFEFWITKDHTGVFGWSDFPVLDKQAGVYFGGDMVPLDPRPFEKWPTPYRFRLEEPIPEIRDHAGMINGD